MGKILKLPVNTFNEFMKEKKINYQDYVLILLYSNHGGKENKLDVEDNHRYLYKNKFIANKEEIESLSNRKMREITKNINKIAVLSDSKMISVCKTNEGKEVYIIPKGEKYVLIEQEILNCLCQFKSNAIKVYLFLKWKLRDGKKALSRKEIANNIGLSIKADENLKDITHIINILVSLCLVKKTKNTMSDDNNYKTNITYELCTYEEFMANYKRNTKGLK